MMFADTDLALDETARLQTYLDGLGPPVVFENLQRPS